MGRLSPQLLEEIDMIKSVVVDNGIEIEEVYPQIKRWCRYDTMALFSNKSDAIIIAVDVNHPDDFIGKKVEDPLSHEWKKVKNYNIVISDGE